MVRCTGTYMLAVFWVLIGYGFLTAVGKRPEIIDLPDGARGATWIIVAIIAAVTARLPRGNRVGLSLLALPVSERIASLLAAWVTGLSSVTWFSAIFYGIALFAIIAVSRLPTWDDLRAALVGETLIDYTTRQGGQP